MTISKGSSGTNGAGNTNGHRLPPIDDEYDIVVVGAGPVGLMAATCLVRWGYKVLQVDDRPESTSSGRADGLHSRTVQVLSNMGFEASLRKHDPALCRSMSFWIETNGKPERLVKLDMTPKTVDTRYPYAITVHQGHIEDVFLADMEKHGVRPRRPWVYKSFSLDTSPENDHPVTVSIAKGDGSEHWRIRAKYLFSAEGAHSTTKKQLGIKTEYKDSKASLFGVVDAIPETDFPAMRECGVLSGSNGTLLIIPREGGRMVRIYIPCDDQTVATLDHIKEQARKIFHPYKIELRDIEWFSSYSIRQGIAEKYGDGRRIFLGGDACHVHSPKAGHGMNLGFGDAQNLAWKIHAVERGIASPKLLQSYEFERRQAATLVIDFDHMYAAKFGQSLMDAQLSRERGEDAGRDHASEMAEAFKNAATLGCGYGFWYAENVASWSPSGEGRGPLLLSPATPFKPGFFFMYTADATRVHDGKVVEFEQEIGSDGSFRIYIFAGKLKDSESALKCLSNQLQRPESFLNKYHQSRRTDSRNSSKGPETPLFTTLLAFIPDCPTHNKHISLPAGLRVSSEHIYADDQEGLVEGKPVAPVVHKKALLEDGEGAVVIVRPDGYIGLALRLVDGPATGETVNKYFAGFLEE